MFLKAPPKFDSKINGHIAIGCAFASLLIVHQSYAHNDAMQGLLFEDRLGQPVFLHAFPDAPCPLSRHPHVTKISQGIHKMIITSRAGAINCSLIHRWHEPSGAFDFHAIWEKLYRYFRSTEII